MALWFSLTICIVNIPNPVISCMEPNDNNHLSRNEETMMKERHVKPNDSKS